MRISDKEIYQVKEISTVGMNPKDKHMFMGNVLGSFGNDNIRGNHIAFFEKKLIKNNETSSSDITTTPYYYAWLCLMTEHLFWAMRTFCFRHSDFIEHDDLTLMYNDLITKFCDTCRNLKVLDDSQLQNLFDKAVKVLELRHAIIHKGFPNLLPIVFEDKHVRNKPSISKNSPKVKFTKESTKESVGWFSHPENFNEIKGEFTSLIKAMRLGPGFSIGF